MLGVLLPDDGPQDYEWYGLASWFAARGVAGVPVRVAGSPCDGLHVEESLRRTGSLAVLAPPARSLAGAGAGALVWACTSGSFIGGRVWAEEQAEGLRAAAGVPATSTALALTGALAALGADETDLLSPYPDAVTDRLAAFLTESGVRPRRVVALDCLRSADSHRLDLQAEVSRLPAADRPLTIPDTAVNSLGLLDALESEAGRPVVSANQASLWAGLRLLGASTRVPRAGRLFALGA